MLDSITAILIRRDGMIPAEAAELVAEARDEAAELIDSGCTLDDLEELVKDYFGLEPDYVMELIN